MENAQLAAEQLLISLKIDNESGVRSNCIWSLCRLYGKLNNTLQESFVDECTKIALFDKEPSVMEEAKTARIRKVFIIKNFFFHQNPTKKINLFDIQYKIKIN